MRYMLNEFYTLELKLTKKGLEDFYVNPTSGNIEFLLVGALHRLQAWTKNPSFIL